MWGKFIDQCLIIERCVWQSQVGFACDRPCMAHHAVRRDAVSLSASFLIPTGILRSLVAQCLGRSDRESAVQSSMVSCGHPSTFARRCRSFPPEKTAGHSPWCTNACLPRSIAIESSSANASLPPNSDSRNPNTEQKTSRILPSSSC